MKTIIELNGINYGSSGSMMMNIASEARNSGFNVYTLCTKKRETLKHNYDNQVFYGSWLDRVISERLSYITGLRDCFNVFQTNDLIKKIKEINPDLIHMHVLHDNFLNYRILFNYLSKSNIPIIWTFHDCSPLTGQCPCFDIVNCDKWQNGCYKCPQIHLEPKSLFLDTTKSMWNYKKNCFTSIKNLTIVTPSNWLANLVKLSYLRDKEIKTIRNGIDLNVFKPLESNFKKENNVSDKHIILGVASYWGERKGLDVFCELAKRLSNDYQIILVGTNDDVDKLLPKNVISIHRTFNKEDLVKIYSCANVFVNPTREDNFPTVNMEALACGIPVITFNTGGSPEIIDETCGSVVEKNNIVKLQNEIIRVCTEKPYKKEFCLSRAKYFDKHDTSKQYINLFKEKMNIK